MPLLEEKHQAAKYVYMGTSMKEWNKDRTNVVNSLFIETVSKLVQIILFSIWHARRKESIDFMSLQIFFLVNKKEIHVGEKLQYNRVII